MVSAKMVAPLAFRHLAPQIADGLPTLAKSPLARYVDASITFSAA
jgi:hypothetical protein